MTAVKRSNVFVKDEIIMLIKDMKYDENTGSERGKFDSVSLFQGEMGIVVYTDDGASVEYSEKCIEHYNDLANNGEMLAEIEDKITRFFLYMYDEWKKMGIYEDIVSDCEEVMKGYKSGRKLTDFLSAPALYIDAPVGEGIGYCIVADCPWEPEHQCEIIIRDDTVLYAGPCEGETPWGDEDDYYCIWEE